MLTHPHTRVRTHTSLRMHTNVCACSRTQTHKAWLQWCDGKCQARGCKHLSLISYSLCSHLGLGYGKERWFILHDKYEFFVRHIWKSEGKKITALALFKRYRFSAQLLSFFRVSGSEVAQGDVVDTSGRGGYCARWQKARTVKRSRQLHPLDV